MRLLEIKNKKILYGVLNWGLGHASRSSKIIEQLIEQQNKITLVSSGEALAYLKNKFPNLVCENSGADEIFYPTHKQLWVKILLQSSKILKSIKKESAFVKQKIENDSTIDLLISDNCYGFYSEKISSIFITHQLNVKSPSFEKKIQKKIHALIQPFSEIWIPDFEGENNLSGQLSRPLIAGKKCTYINPISILHPAENEIKPVYDYCAIVSGPEKQRTVFENKILKFFKKQHQPTTLIRGIVGKDVPEIASTKLMTVHNFKSGEELNQIINQSKIIIARSGYSTIMDMYFLKKSCILLPTPGQTEQQYLFKKHFGKSSQKLGEIRPKLISPCKN